MSRTGVSSKYDGNPIETILGCGHSYSYLTDEATEAWSKKRLPPKMMACTAMDPGYAVGSGVESITADPRYLCMTSSRMHL